MKHLIIIILGACILMSSILGNPTYCRNITINNTMPIILFDFPVPINITFDADMQADFRDIRVNTTSCSDTTGTNIWCEQILKSDSSYLQLFCRTNLSIGTNIISYSYGDAALSNYWNDSMVWLNYSLVIHANGSVTDSTRNYPLITVNNAVPNGKNLGWGNTYYFDGVSDYLNVTAKSDAPLAYWPRTLEAWGYVTVLPSASGDASGHRIFHLTNITGTSLPYTFRIRETTNVLRWDQLYNNSVVVHSLASSAFALGNQSVYFALAGPLNRSSFIQVNNAYAVSGTGTSGYRNVTGLMLLIGASSSTAGEWRGYLSEMRYSPMSRSQWWLNYTYVTMADNGKYVTAGDEYSYPAGDTDSCGCPDIDTDWPWDFNDNCTIDDDCDIGTGTVYVKNYNVGTWIINAIITAKTWILNGTTSQYIKGNNGGYLKKG